MSSTVKKIDSIEAIEMVIGAAQRKYVTLMEGCMLYGMGRDTFDKLARESGARRKVGKRVIVNTVKLDEYIEVMFSE